MCRHPAAQPVAWNLVLCLHIFAVALDGGSVALHLERRAPCLDGTPKRNPLAVGQHPPLGPELVGFGRLRAHLYPRGEGPRTSHRPWPAVPIRSHSAHRRAVAPAAGADQTLGPLATQAGPPPYWSSPGSAAAGSMGSPCVTPPRWRSSPAGRPSGAGGLSSGLWAGGRRTPSARKMHPGGKRSASIEIPFRGFRSTLLDFQ
jgi:hypothetical protein